MDGWMDGRVTATEDYGREMVRHMQPISAGALKITAVNQGVLEVLWLYLYT